MGGIFLSYRRDDASGWAGRLYEHLVREWGPDQVFMDIDAIAPGEDFRKAITRTMQLSDTVLVVIGPGWLEAQDEAGHRRLDDEGDTHRTEVHAALDADVRVIPVLVGGADMPPVARLPGPLKELAYRNAAVIDDRRFPADVRGLIASVTHSREATAPAWESPDLARPSVAPLGAATSTPSQATTLSRPASASRAPTGTEASIAAFLTTPAALLALGGMLVVLTWGVFVRPGWHDELVGLRAATALLLVVVAAAGLWTRQWRLVRTAGVIGLVGLLLWATQLLATGHTLADLFSPATDGVTNVLTLVGAAVVVAASYVAGSRPAQRS